METVSSLLKNVQWVLGSILDLISFLLSFYALNSQEGMTPELFCKACVLDDVTVKNGFCANGIGRNTTLSCGYYAASCSKDDIALGELKRAFKHMDVFMWR